MYLMCEIWKNIANLYNFLVSMRLKVKPLNWEQSPDVSLGFRIPSLTLLLRVCGLRQAGMAVLGQYLLC